MNTSMIFLPTMTCISGLMGKCVIKTHREEINFQEPNILWSAVAAPPGKQHFIVNHCTVDIIFLNSMVSTKNQLLGETKNIFQCEQM